MFGRVLNAPLKLFFYENDFLIYFKRMIDLKKFFFAESFIKSKISVGVSNLILEEAFHEIKN